MLGDSADANEQPHPDDLFHRDLARHPRLVRPAKPEVDVSSMSFGATHRPRSVGNDLVQASRQKHNVIVVQCDKVNLCLCGSYGGFAWHLLARDRGVDTLLQVAIPTVLLLLSQSQDAFYAARAPELDCRRIILQISDVLMLSFPKNLGTKIISASAILCPVTSSVLVATSYLATTSWAPNSFIKFQRHKKLLNLSTSNKCHATSNKCLTSSIKELVVTSASLLVTSAKKNVPRVPRLRVPFVSRRSWRTGVLGGPTRP